MGQIITSLINFFLEVGRSNDLYKTKKNSNRMVKALSLFFIAAFLMLAVEGFTTGYVSKAENIELKAEIKLLESLRYGNEALKARNEVLSKTLGFYIGRSLVDKINDEKQIDPDNLPKIDPDTDPNPPASSPKK